MTVRTFDQALMAFCDAENLKKRLQCLLEIFREHGPPSLVPSNFKYHQIDRFTPDGVQIDLYVEVEEEIGHQEWPEGNGTFDDLGLSPEWVVDGYSHENIKECSIVVSREWLELALIESWDALKGIALDLAARHAHEEKTRKLRRELENLEDRQGVLRSELELALADAPHDPDGIV